MKIHPTVSKFNTGERKLLIDDQKQFNGKMFPLYACRVVRKCSVANRFVGLIVFESWYQPIVNSDFNSVFSIKELPFN